MELKKDVLKEQETLKKRIFDDMIEYVKAIHRYKQIMINFS